MDMNRWVINFLFLLLPTPSFGGNVAKAHEHGIGIQAVLNELKNIHSIQDLDGDDLSAINSLISTYSESETQGHHEIANQLQTKLQTLRQAPILPMDQPAPTRKRKSDEMTSSRKKSSKTAVCEICSRILSSKPALKKHMLTHTGEKPYQCEKCQKGFSTSSNYQRHMRTHTNSHCEVCEKDFSTQASLKLHMRMHTGKKSGYCEICKKDFGAPSRLKEHMRTHTGEKPYQCEECQMDFSTSTNLLQHMRTHTGEKPYQCEKCQKGFSTASSLLQHMKTNHGAPHCEVCGKNFSSQSNLQKHLIQHAGEKTHRCEVCEKEFSTSSNLNKHRKRVHKSEGPSKFRKLTSQEAPDSQSNWEQNSPSFCEGLNSPLSLFPQIAEMMDPLDSLNSDFLNDLPSAGQTQAQAQPTNHAMDRPVTPTASPSFLEDWNSMDTILLDIPEFIRSSPSPTQGPPANSRNVHFSMDAAPHAIIPARTPHLLEKKDLF
jgi:KRAB domain-containing zinc finger protein